MPNLISEKIKVLMVDDDKVLPDIDSKSFQKSGYEFEIIHSPDGDFVFKVAAINPDIILMDLTFIGSQRNGAEAAEILQMDDRTKSIPIIFLTNADNNECSQKAKRLSSSLGFLTKIDYIPSELVVKVRELYDGYLKKKN